MAAEGLCSLLPCVSPATKGFGAAAIRGGQEGVLRKIWSVRLWCETLAMIWGPDMAWKYLEIVFYHFIHFAYFKPSETLTFEVFSSPGPLSCNHIIIHQSFTHLRDLETPPVVFAASSDALWSCTIPTSIAPTIPPATLEVERHPPSNAGNASIVEMGH